jgi:phage terminase large subunit
LRPHGAAQAGRGGALPDSPELLAALTQTTFTFKGDPLILEPRMDIKAKLGYSDEAGGALLRRSGGSS